MSHKIALYSRLVFVSLPVCVAVMLFIMCSDAARASPIATQVDTGVKPNILRSVFSPYSQRHSLSAGIPPTETGLQPATNEMTGNSRQALSIIDHQSNPVWFTGGGFSYNQNIPDDRQARAGMQRGHGAGGVRSASSTFTSHSQRGGQSFERPQSRFNSYPLIITKSSQKEAGSPFHQSSTSSQVWYHKDAQKSHSQGQAPSNVSPKLATDKTAWPLKAGEYWSTLPTLRGHYTGYKETNELSAVRAQSPSGGIQSSKFLGFASQTVSHAPSISSGLDAFVIKRNPSPEKLTSSITDFSQRLSSVTSSETLRPKNVQSYLFKDSQTSFDTSNTVTGGQQASSGLRGFTTMPQKQSPSVAQVYSRFASNFQQLGKKVPTKEDDANPLYLNSSVAQYGGQTDRSIRYQLISSMYPPAQLSLHPASGKGKTIKSFVPISHAAPQDNYAASSEKSVTGSPVITAAGGSVNGYKPAQSSKIIYGIGGFENTPSSAAKAKSIPPSSERTNSRRHSFDKGKDYKFKIANIHPSLLPKYSFGQRRASILIHTPAKHERTRTDYSPPSLDIIQSTTVSTSRALTSGFKAVQPPLPESDAGMDNKRDHRQVRFYKRMYGLRGFGPRPLEGAKALVRKPDKSASLQQSFEPGSSQIWQPKSSRWYNQTGETEAESSNISIQRQNELNEQSNEDFKPLLKTAGSTEPVEHSRFTPDKYKKNQKIYTFLGFQSVQNRIGNAPKETHWKYTEQNPTAASPTHRVSSAHCRSAGDLKVESSQASAPRTPNKSKPVAMKASLLNRSTSSTVRGKRVKGKHINSKKLNESASLTNDTLNVAIVRLPTRPARVKAVTYADILGSASFSSVRATPQTPTTPADEVYFPNTTAVTKQEEEVGYWTLNPDGGVQSRENTSRSPEANAKDEVEDFSSAGEMQFGLKSREYDGGMKTFDAFLDNEESGSGVFNLSDVLPTDTTESQGLGEDSLELDYLRISTGNISFKSMKLSHTEK
ncbi:uncharacterized protein LOC111665743 isoform X1 [Seriola lalandi dorsalis]|uniref:uncharacterized protein LOC111665743 isoform X1 n=2 Tax=Seriola lalandi dorsalis TaxID=1841481 RepID=UPI000C6F8274|nr:uncharacterized protein LOC111665743 isoform X1 [Seriola lalandi dorsalis]